MDYTVAFDAPPEKIYQDFTSSEYWQSLMDSYRFVAPQSHSEVTSFTTGELRHRHRLHSGDAPKRICLRSHAR